MINTGYIVDSSNQHLSSRALQFLLARRRGTRITAGAEVIDDHIFCETDLNNDEQNSTVSYQTERLSSTDPA
jgi:hypothetical protein